MHICFRLVVARWLGVSLLSMVGITVRLAMATDCFIELAISCLFRTEFLPVGKLVNRSVNRSTHKFSAQVNLMANRNLLAGGLDTPKPLPLNIQ